MSGARTSTASSRESVRRLLYPAIVAAALLSAWQALVVGFELPPYLVPSPLLMVQTLVTDWAALGSALLVTMKITLLAFLVATVLGVLISFVFVQSRALETALFPYAVLLQVTPIVAVAPLIIIWVKDPTASMVICAALVALFPVISNTTLGLRSVDPDLQSYFQLNRATPHADAGAPAHPERAAVLLRRPADLERAGADRRGGRRVRRRHRRHRRRASPTRSCRPASSSTSRACSPRCC